ncbi:MAG: hypothetical protein FWG87_02465, partial [Defluviitaleaceae bacterium]|nr:hypothetical protein [Defluviitaleaceae bacterium]
PMRKQFRRNAGLALPTVVLFIIMMATVGTLMVVVSNRSMKMSNATPTLDGHYYAAESAINRAMVSLVNDVSDFSVDTVEEAAKQAAADIAAAVGTRFSSFPSTGSTVPTGTMLGNYLKTGFDTDSGYQEGIRNAVHTYISTAINLPAPHSSTPSIGVSEAYFWLIDGADNDTWPLGADVTSAMDGFNAPGYANLKRVSASDDTLWVGLVDVTATEPYMDDSHPNHEDDIPGLKMYRTTVTIKPYITFESYAGTVTGGQSITQDIVIPIGKFNVHFGMYEYAGSPDGSASGNLYGVTVSAYDGGLEGRGVTYGNEKSHTPPAVSHIPPLNKDENQGAFDRFTASMYDVFGGLHTDYGSSNINIYSTPGNAPVTAHIDIVGGNRVLTIDGVVTPMPPGDPPNLILNTGMPLILTGDFTGVNLLNRGPSLVLGSADVPFKAENVAGKENQTFIAATTRIEVNVRDGLALENVNVATDGFVNFNSPPDTLGSISLGATFMGKEGGIHGTIAATAWKEGQIPQFYARSNIGAKDGETYNPLMFKGVDSEGNSAKVDNMGGLFVTSDGGHVMLNVDNDGADFNGILIANESVGSFIEGDTNINGTKLPTMDMMPELEDFFENDNAGDNNNLGNAPAPQFQSSSWDVSENTHQVPTDNPSFHTNP